MPAVTLSAEVRTTLGRRATRLLREKGLVPGIVYGRGRPPVAVAIAAEALEKALKGGARVVDIVIGNDRDSALLYDPQPDMAGEHVRHVDFVRVAQDVAVEVAVRIELKGTPAGQAEGGVLQQTLHELTVKCLPRDIPEKIVVDVADLKIGDSRRVKELTLPHGVATAVDSEVTVATVRHQVTAPEPGAAPAVEGPAEPEVIKPEGRAEAEEEAGEKGGEKAGAKGAEKEKEKK
ncbi:MAG: 50S ribosomal protein L25 [Planctomycetales bacterium]|nr:50S ribosomal protein L25 [Planctomycetales bacterium]